MNRLTAALCSAVLAQLLATPTGAAQLTRVELLDGSTVEGEFRTLSADTLVIERVGASESVDLRRVSEIRFAPPAEESLPASIALATLADGSRLPVANLKFDGQRVSFSLPRTAETPGQVVELATSGLRALLLSPEERHEDDWNRFVASPSSSDRIVVFRKQGASIDGIECSVESITPTSVTVQLDGEPITVPIEKVYGVVFAALGGELEAVRDSALVETKSGLRLLVTQMQSTAERELRVASPLGITLTIPAEQLVRIDYSLARIRWLSDLKPVRHNWRPYYGFPAGLDEDDRPLGMATNRSLHGEPLRVIRPESYPRPGSVEEFPRGIALRGGSELVYALPSGFEWFHATAGIDPETVRLGNVMLQIYADEKLVYEHAVDGAGPIRIRTRTNGARRLRIVVGHGENLDLGDNLHLGAARVTR